MQAWRFAPILAAILSIIISPASVCNRVGDFSEPKALVNEPRRGSDVADGYGSC